MEFVAYILAYFAPSKECETYAKTEWLASSPTIRTLRFCYDQLINETTGQFIVSPSKMYYINLAPKITLKWKNSRIWLCKCDKPSTEE